MKSEKRRWLYAGIAVPPGIALVRPARPRVTTAALARSGGGVLLIGGDPARGLGAPLRRLAQDARVPWFEDVRPGTAVEDWLGRPWLHNAVGRYRPGLVLVGLEPTAVPGAMAALDESLGSTQRLWLPRSGPLVPFRTLPAASLHLPLGRDRMTPTVAGYAGWAEAVWRTIAS